ncbi:MAG TPA: hypothetical protein VIW78_09985, partial [Burkholderiales bacterium]
MLFKIIGVIIATVLIYGYEPIRPLWIPFAIIALGVVFVIEGVRVMPNTCSAVGCGMAGICRGANATAD